MTVEKAELKLDEAETEPHEKLKKDVEEHFVKNQVAKSNLLISDELDEKIRAKIHEYLDKYLTNKLDIAVFGASCVHKNALINNLANRSDEEDANIEDQVNNLKIDEELYDYCFVSALKPVAYRHKNNPNITVWDIPENFDQSINDYLHGLNLNKYDAILLCRKNSSLDSIDLAVTKQAKKLNKKFYLIQLHDEHNKNSDKQCCQNLIDSKLDAQKQRELIEEIKNEIKSELSKERLCHENIYLIAPSVKDRKRLEFVKLNMDMLEHLDKEKMETLALALEPFSNEIIQKKFNILKSRVFYAAIVSTLCGILLFPHLALIADMSFIAREIWFYQKQFGLNKDTLKKLSQSSNFLYEKFLSVISKSKYASLIILNDVYALTGLLIKTVPLFTVSNTADLIKFIPILGSIIHGSISYATTKYALVNILEEFAKIATDINTLILDYKTLEASSTTAGDAATVQTSSTTTTTTPEKIG